MWTFGRKLGLGFSIPLALFLVVGLVSYRALDALTNTSGLVTHTHAVIEHLQSDLGILKDAETGQRGYVITGSEAFLEPYAGAMAALPKVERELRALTRDNPRQQRRLNELEPLVAQKVAELKHSIDVRRKDGFEAAQHIVAGGEGKKIMDGIRRVLGEMEREERELLEQRARETAAAANGARATVLGGTLLCILFCLGLGVWLARTLTRQIGSAVGQVTTSSTELQASANQQATGAKEQATSVSEIATTISELLATSRQIAESARRVSQVAEQTASAARSGDDTVVRARDAIAAIQREVAAIVGHMLDLGKKSQQIGSILSIVGELAEQTNILSINATIEAAGAGESGRRFGVVADEIRKLSDRVGAAAKEIRVLIDEVRAAVDTTVTATESGSKAAHAGSQHFGDVTVQFKQIVGLVVTASDAGREIELSTKQQATAVEQVNVAIANVAQATRENEATSLQTLDTASQLARLSADLMRVIESDAAGPVTRLAG